MTPADALTKIEAELRAATPGPWWTERGARDCVYAKVPGGRPNGEGLLQVRYYSEARNAENNATLISHAPTYLAALVEVAKKAQLHLDYHHADDYHGELLRAALAALTKAVQ